MSRISAAFSSFFSILFSGSLPDQVASEFGFTKAKPTPVPPPPEPKVKISDGALQLLQILQRDSRAALNRHFTLAPVIDGVEGTHQKLDGNKAPDPNRIKLIGNVPASGKVPGGTLRHRGWMVSDVTLPPLGKQDPSILAPAEIEVE